LLTLVSGRYNNYSRSAPALINRVVDVSLGRFLQADLVSLVSLSLRTCHALPFIHKKFFRWYVGIGR